MGELELAGGAKRPNIEPELKTLTLEDIQELISNSTTKAQRMTALKVL